MLQILPRRNHLLHVPRLLLGFPGNGLDVDDALALLAGDLRPVIGIGRVGQVLVLLELLADGVQEVIEVDVDDPRTVETGSN